MGGMKVVVNGVVEVESELRLEDGVEKGIKWVEQCLRRLGKLRLRQSWGWKTGWKRG